MTPPDPREALSLAENQAIVAAVHSSDGCSCEEVRAVVARLLATREAEALERWADSIDADLAAAPNQSPDMRLWHGAFASNARARAQQLRTPSGSAEGEG